MTETTINDKSLRYTQNKINPAWQIAVICPNPAIDITANSTNFAIGDNIANADIQMRAGGKGANVACVAADLGAAAALVAPLGGKTGALFQDLLNPRVLLNKKSVHATTRLCLAIKSSDAITEIRGRGMALTAQEWEAFVVAAQKSAVSADAVAICGSFPAEAPARWIKELVAAIDCPRIYVDTSGTHLLAAAEITGITIAPNFDELQSLCSEELHSKPLNLANQPQTAAGLVAMRQQKTDLRVLATLGKAGAGLLIDGQWHLATPPEVNGNPVGAGDATLAAFIAAEVCGLSPSVALQHAVAAGSSAVSQPEAGRINPDEMKKLVLQTSLQSMAFSQTATSSN